MKLFDKGVGKADRDEAYRIWERTSERYAKDVSGVSIGILNNPSPAFIFNKIKFPAFQLNSKETNVITGGK